MNTQLLKTDKRSLKASIAKSLRKEKLRALLLIAPLLIFISLSFIVPVFDMLWRSVDNKIVVEILPKTVESLKKWNDNTILPHEDVYRSLAEDLKIARENRTHTRLGTRLNYELSGMSSLFRKTGRHVKKISSDKGSYKDQFLKIDKKWAQLKTWSTIKEFSGDYTIGYFLAALDLQKRDGDITFIGDDKAIHVKLLLRTIWLSLLVTCICIILGYPVAFLLANTPMRTSNILMILVLLPFWTSLLVRTASWTVLLQQQGVVNDILVWIGIIGDDGRLAMINNQFGTLIAMSHILLPFMILPLYSVMKSISPSYVRAAKSLGANDFYAFIKIYFPNSIPGIGAGSILVFILSIGYYITPEIVGGTEGVLISNRIAYHISSSLNWGLGAALGTLTLLLVFVLYWLYDKIVGIDNVKLN